MIGITDIRASATSDVLPEYECNHQTHNICLCDWGDDCAMNNEPNLTYCPKCGEKL